MFAILLSEKMDPFYQNISAFPTVIYTILLGLCVVYWLGAVLGVVDIDALNIDVDIDLNSDSSHASSDVLAGLLLRFGWVGVPVIITLTVMLLLGWLISYYAMYLLLGTDSSAVLRYLVGIPVFLFSLVVAAWAAGRITKPLRPLFANATQQTYKHVIGQTAVVRTGRVDNTFGEVTLADGGAGLILKARASGEDKFVRGDRVVIFEKLNDDNLYRVISEEEFSGL